MQKRSLQPNARKAADIGRIRLGLTIEELFGEHCHAISRARALAGRVAALPASERPIRAALWLF
jgi:hypothetical protein